MKNNKIKWHRNLYYGEKAGRRGRKICEQFEDGGCHPRLYLLVLPSNDSNLLDILPQPVLLQAHYQRLELYAVGVSVGKREAMELAGKIVMDAYHATGKTDVRQFLGDDYAKEPDPSGGQQNSHGE